MRHWKRLIYYLAINILVSTCTVVVVLSIWDRWHPFTPEEPGQLATQVQLGALPALPPSGTLNEGFTNNPLETIVASNVTPSSLPPTEMPGEEQEYRVQQGDTLGAIAVKFEISLEELMEANGISDPDRLEVGQVLIIPLPVKFLPTKTALPVEEMETPTMTKPARTPTPTAATGEAQVAIESVIGAGDLDTERVQIKHAGGGELSLAGWQLVDEGGQVFTFPQLVLFEGGAVNLYTKAGLSTPAELFWGLEASVWQSGEKVVLKDKLGKVRVTYRVP